MRQGRFLIMLLAGLCLAEAAPATPSVPARRSPDPISDITAATAAYGNWLARLIDIETPVEAQLTGLDPIWREAFAQGGTGSEIAARLRPILARAVAEVETADRKIDALQSPHLPELELEADLQPAAMAGEMHTLNGRIRHALAAFGPLIDAIAHDDRAAMDSAASEIIASFSLVLESKILLARASLATTPRDDPAWALGNIDLILDRVSARVYAAWRPFAPAQVDPALSRDLVMLADELDANADEGGRRLDATIADIQTGLDSDRRDRNQRAAELGRRVLSILASGRDCFSASREAASVLRSEAERSREHAFTVERLRSFFGQLLPLRQRMSQIGRQMASELGRLQ